MRRYLQVLLCVAIVLVAVWIRPDVDAAEPRYEFQPDRAATRAEIVVMIHRALDSPPASSQHSFTDAPRGQFYDAALDWAAEAGVIFGVAIPPDPFEQALATHFADQPDKARRVAWCESKGNNFAVGAAGERGRWQIHPGWMNGWGPGSAPPLIPELGYSWDDMFDPMANAHVASTILDRNGWVWYPTWTCGRA